MLRLLSNFHDLAFKHVTKKYDFFSDFDGGVVSYEENMLKPENEIYKHIYVLIKFLHFNTKPVYYLCRNFIYTFNEISYSIFHSIYTLKKHIIYN